MNRNLEAWINRWWWPLLALGVGLNLTTLFGALTEPDSALYAIVARHVAESGDLVNLRAYGQDWIDKPHFPFWMAGLSFRLFGINEVAYRLPALGFFFLGVFSTWRLGVLLFDRTVAKVAALLLLTAEHLVLSNADVRMEPYLVGLVVTAVFHFLSARGENWRGHLVAGAAFTAAALMTKGPFVVIPIGAALLSYQWRALLKWRWLLAVVLVAVFLAPELVSLYLQFDSHPEKEVFGHTSFSGIRFFFWDNQFGRFLATGPVVGFGRDPSFYFHVVLWAFLPWSLWLYQAVGTRLRGAFKGEPSPWAGGEWNVLGAGLSTMVLFSASRAQLPHYLNIVFPFFALLVATWLARLTSVRGRRWATVLGLSVAVGMPVAAAGLLILVQVPGTAWVVGALLVGAASGFIFFRGLEVESTLGRAFIAAVAVNLALGLSYTPFLLRFQVGRAAAEIANARPLLRTGLVEVESLTFDFHLREPVYRLSVDDAWNMTAAAPVRLLMTTASQRALEDRGLHLEVLGGWDAFHVSMPTWAFLDARTRPSVVEHWVLAEATR